jgi:nucleotide-binding universal stress UspA family protein
MYSTVVVPLDGSALAERALPYATQLVRHGGARLVLVRAALAHTVPGVDPTDAQLAATECAERELETTAERLRDQGLSVETHVYYGEAAWAITDVAERQSAELLVMSTHGRGGLGRWVYGSVAQQVLRKATVPILLVSAACERPWPAEGPIHILVPLDGSAFAEEALGSARQLASTSPR